MVQIKQKSGHGVESPHPRSFWCGIPIIEPIWWHTFSKISWLLNVACILLIEPNFEKVSTSCEVEPYDVPYDSECKHSASQCNTVQHSATQCNTVQHSATQCTTPAVAWSLKIPPMTPRTCSAMMTGCSCSCPPPRSAPATPPRPPLLPSRAPNCAAKWQAS